MNTQEELDHAAAKVKLAYEQLIDASSIAETMQRATGLHHGFSPARHDLGSSHAQPSQRPAKARAAAKAARKARRKGRK